LYLVLPLCDTKNTRKKKKEKGKKEQRPVLARGRFKQSSFPLGSRPLGLLG
jgi:hypothetical protein